MTVTRRPSASTLYLPIERPAIAWIGSAVVLAVYASTMARDLSFYDSPELLLVAHDLGVGHPIGQPLHTLLGWVFTHLPLLPPAAGGALLSALPGSLVVLPVFSLAQAVSPALRRRRGAALATIAIVAHAIHGAVWEPMTRVEVYSLATLPALWAAARLVHVTSGEEPNPRPERALLGAGLALGLAASSNAVIAAVTTAALLPAVVAAVIRRRLRVKAVLLMVAGGVVGLLPLAYIPVAARRAPEVFAWGAPTGGERLLSYLRGADFAHNQGPTAGIFGDHVLQWLGWSVSHGVLPILIVGIVGWIVLLRRGGARWLSLLATVLTVAFLCSNVIFDPRITDYLGYLATPMLLAAAGSAALVAAGGARTDRMRVYAGVGLALLVLGALIAPPAVPIRARAVDTTARRMAEGVLMEAPRDAIVVVGSDHWAAPLLYVTEAEGRRADVVVLAYGLSSSTWFWEHLYARHPTLTPIALEGPGGRAERVRRFLDAHPDRPVLIENAVLGEELRTPMCDVGWLVAVERNGECPAGASARRASRELAAALHTVGDGSPPSDDVLALVALDRGELLWRLGRGRDALTALLSGVPGSMQPAGLQPVPVQVPPLRGPLPRWERPVPLGDPAQNLFLASELLRASGDAAGSDALLRHAGDLPEALRRGTLVTGE